MGLPLFREASMCPKPPSPWSGDPREGAPSSEPPSAPTPGDQAPTGAEASLSSDLGGDHERLGLNQQEDLAGLKTASSNITAMLAHSPEGISRIFTPSELAAAGLDATAYDFVYEYRLNNGTLEYRTPGENAPPDEEWAEPDPYDGHPDEVRDARMAIHAYLLHQVAREATQAPPSRQLPPPPIVPSVHAVLNSQGIAFDEIKTCLDARSSHGRLTHCTPEHLQKVFDFTSREARLEHSRWMTLRDPRIYPIHTRFTLSSDQVDQDDEFERTTPAGAEWEIFEIEPYDDPVAQYSVTCEATGGWIHIGHEELLDQGFTLTGMNPETEALMSDPPEMRIQALKQQVHELLDFQNEWVERFRFLAERNSPTSPAAIDEVATVLYTTRNTDADERSKLVATIEDLQTQLASLNKPTSWRTVHKNLYLQYLQTSTPEHREETGYPSRYLVTEGAMSHAAFMARADLEQWLRDCGLTLETPIPKENTFDAVSITGSYATEMHISYDKFYGLPAIREIQIMSNGDLTLARITKDEETGMRTVHTLNPNCKHRPIFPVAHEKDQR